MTLHSDLVKSHGSVSAAARASGIPRTTFRRRLVSESIDVMRSEMGQMKLKLQEMESSFRSLSRIVESISQSVELCASKRDLDYKIQDVKNLCDWVHKQNPYRRRH